MAAEFSQHERHLESLCLTFTLFGSLLNPATSLLVHKKLAIIDV